MFLYRGYFLHPFFSVARKIASVSPALRFIDTVWTMATNLSRDTL
jgi:hypothetical protein